MRYFVRYLVRHLLDTCETLCEIRREILEEILCEILVRYLVKHVPRAQCIHGGPAGCADAVRPALPRAPLPVVRLVLFRLD